MFGDLKDIYSNLLIVKTAQKTLIILRKLIFTMKKSIQVSRTYEFYKNTVMFILVTQVTLNLFYIHIN